MLTKEKIFKKCEKHPKEIFHILTRNNFQLAKRFFGSQRVSIEFNFETGEYYYKFWKNNKCAKDHGVSPAWKFFLRELILRKKPINFLKKFL